jgi:SAM-dependent methyltransferase
LIELGHRVLGLEVSTAVAAKARLRADSIGNKRFQVFEGPMELAEPPVEEGAHVVLAMGSLQYTSDQEAVVKRFASWLRPGGALAVLVDSQAAMTLELIARGESQQALNQLAEGIGHWCPPEGSGASSEVHLSDRQSLERMLASAGLTQVVSAGLLVSFSALGRDGWEHQYAKDPAALIELDRRLAGFPGLADLGKQILVTGWRPVTMRSDTPE